MFVLLLFSRDAHHRDLLVLTQSFPPRRSSALQARHAGAGADLADAAQGPRRGARRPGAAGGGRDGAGAADRTSTRLNSRHLCSPQMALSACKITQSAGVERAPEDT